MWKALKKKTLAVRGQAAVEALSRNGYDALYCPTVEEAARKVMELVPEGAGVGCGGSLTLREMGLTDALREQGNELYDHWLPNTSPGEMVTIRNRQPVSDVFLTSANAITMDGQIVNVDGLGNRVASTIFGPKKVVIVAGMNKVVQTLDEAMKRSREVAGVMNAIRLKSKAPCVELGRCTDCRHSNRICNVTVILHRRPSGGDNFIRDYHVILVGEDLGY